MNRIHSEPHRVRLVSTMGLRHSEELTRLVLAVIRTPSANRQLARGEKPATLCARRAPKPPEAAEDLADVEPGPAFTDRWRYTSNAVEAPGVMMMTHKGFSHPGYMRPPDVDRPPYVRIGILVACAVVLVSSVRGGLTDPTGARRRWATAVAVLLAGSALLAVGVVRHVQTPQVCCGSIEEAASLVR